MKKKKDEPQEERRQYVRISKSFVLTYHDANNPSIQQKVTQLKNISKGGMCIITETSFEPDTILAAELNTQYISENTFFECIVLESHEKMKNIIYETRVEFKKLSSQAQRLLEKLEDHFKKEQEAEEKGEDE